MILKINKKNTDQRILVATVLYISLARGIAILSNPIIVMLICCIGVVFTIKYCKKMTLEFLLFAYVCLGLIGFSAINENNRVLIIKNLFHVSTFTFVLLCPILIFLIGDPHRLLIGFKKIGYIIVFVYSAALIQGARSGHEYDYITLGSTMIPFWAVILQNYFLNRKKTDGIIALLSGIIMCLFASRGIGVSVIGTFVIFLLLYTNYRKKIILAIAAASLFLCREKLIEVLNLVYNYFLSQDINIRFLYTLINFGTDNMSDVKLTSGRNIIWQLTLEKIAKSPWTGYGLYGDRAQLVSYAADLYVHNIELQIILQFGCIVGGCIIVYIIYMFYKMVKGFDDWTLLYISFFIPTIISLQFSMEYYLHIHFWMTVAMYFAAKRDREKHGYCIQNRIPCIGI